MDNILIREWKPFASANENNHFLLLKLYMDMFDTLSAMHIGGVFEILFIADILLS